MEDIEIRERIPASTKLSIEHSYPSVDEELVGFDDHEEIITNNLMRGTRNLDVIPIVGMTGIGKTALARKIYNSRAIVDHFDVRAWYHVSQVYDTRKLGLEILKQIRGDECDNMDDTRDVSKYLDKRRYLIVLDDILGTETWGELRPYFFYNNIGSRIMVTTRDEQLSWYVRTFSPPYLLPILKDEQSWELLQKKVFQGEDCPLELRSVGSLVAKKCSGLPSSIIKIAGILSRGKREASLWLEVAYDISSHALEEESMKKIQSSYDHLANHLKPCLLYMGLFPKGYEIPVADLLKWWIAEEFVESIDEMTDPLELEQSLKTCLHNLVRSNLVVVSKRRYNDKMKCCIVLDQVREFCLRKITEEKFMQHIDMDEQRLCTYIHDTMTSEFKERESFGINRGFLEFIAHPKFSIMDSKSLFPLLNNFRLIRVLHLLDFYLDNSWAAAFQPLIHLRYLAIFVKAFDFKWVSHLLHLQTLRVRSSYIMISPAIWKMENLMHVDINEFPITWENDDRVNFEESTDIGLVNLKTLGMCSMSVADMTPKFWKKFPYLEELRLHIDEFGDVPNYLGSRLMSFEMFPSHLRDLSLSEIFLTDEIVSTIAKLQRLKILKLSEIYFTGEKIWDLNDKKFKKLKVLKLRHVFMTQWICSDESFPALEYLVIKSCSKLEEIPLSFPSLRSRKVINCSNLKKN